MAKIDEERVRRIEDLVRRLERFPDHESREVARSLMEAILELHGAGLERMLDIVFEMGDSGRTAIRRFAGDPLVASLLVLHGLHPDDIVTRVEQTLAKIHGHAELLGVFEGTVRIRVSGGGCGFKESVEAALHEAVPDASAIVIEESPPANGFVSLSSLGTGVQRSI
jgi:hypothetical protein